MARGHNIIAPKTNKCYLIVVNWRRQKALDSSEPELASTITQALHYNKQSSTYYVKKLWWVLKCAKHCSAFCHYTRPFDCRLVIRYNKQRDILRQLKVKLLDPNEGFLSNGHNFAKKKYLISTEFLMLPSNMQVSFILIMRQAKQQANWWLYAIAYHIFLWIVQQVNKMMEDAVEENKASICLKYIEPAFDILEQNKSYVMCLLDWLIAVCKCQEKMFPRTPFCFCLD